MSTHAGKIAQSEKTNSKGVGFLLGTMFGQKRRSGSGGMTAEDWENQNRLEDLRHERDTKFETHRSEEGRKTITHKEGEGRKTITHKQKTRSKERGEIFTDLDARPHVGSYEQGADGQYKVTQRETKPAKAAGPGRSRQLKDVNPANNTKTAASGQSTSTPAARPGRSTKPSFPPVGRAGIPNPSTNPTGTVARKPRG
jgi:hypothetical protein